MRRLIAALVLVLGAVAPVAAQDEAGFVPLFNGQDLTGWVVGGDAAGWQVRDGVIRSDGGLNGQFLRTAEQYGDFVLRLDWKLSPVGNSGVVVRGLVEGAGYQEIQLLAPWTPTRDDLHCTGSLYGYVAVNPRPDEAPERWRSLEITCSGPRLTVAVDGQVCTQANLDEIPDLKAAARRGYIALQDSHAGAGEWVEFRNLRLKDLDWQSPEFLAGALRADDPATRAKAQQAAAQVGAPMVGPVFGLLAEGTPQAMRVGEGALYSLAAVASRPGSEAQRTDLAEALMVQLGGAPSPRARQVAARLLSLVGGDDTVPALAAALREADTFEAARFALERIPGEAAGQALLAALPELPAEQQVGLIHTLGARRDQGAVPALMDLGRAAESPVQRAAIQALGRIGDGAAAPVVAAEAGRGSAAAREGALHAMLALADAQQAADPELAVRLCRRAFDKALTKAQRQAALMGLAAAGDPDILARLRPALGDPGSRATALRLLARLPGTAATDLLRAEVEAAQGTEKAALLGLLTERSFPAALPQLVAATEGADEAAQVAALNLLATRPAPEMADLFLRAAAGPSAAVRAAAVRGYVAVAGAVHRRGNEEQALAMHDRALELAPDDAGRAAAVMGLAAIASPASLARLDGLAAQGTLPAQVAAAYLAVGDRLAKGGDFQEAISVYTKAATLSPPTPAGAAAIAKLRELGVTTDFGAERGFVTHWWLLQPVPNAGQSAYGTAFPPEQGVAPDQEVPIGDQRLRWQPYPVADNAYGIVELSTLFPGTGEVACYAYAEVPSDADRDVLLKLGTDDGFELWLNGRRLAGQREGRALTVDQDTIPSHLVAGTNHLLLKVLQGGGRWAFCVRLTDTDGRPLDLTPPTE